MLKKNTKATVIKKSQLHKTDTGSSAVQIAITSKRIEELANHLKKNKKDNHSRRGLVKMVSARRKNLKYLEKRDKKQYDEIMKKIKLKK